jgi:hypothetical protein
VYVKGAASKAVQPGSGMNVQRHVTQSHRQAEATARADLRRSSRPVGRDPDAGMSGPYQNKYRKGR